MNWDETVENQFFKSDVVLVMVKDHLVIDYVNAALQLKTSANGELHAKSVSFEKLSPQNSIRISLNFYACRFWYIFGKNKQRLEVHREEDSESVSEDSLINVEASY